MVTPTVSTGIPTAELFAADFLPAASAAALEACYVETIRRWPRLFGDPDFSLADETLERLEGPWPSAEAWDPAWWRARLWDKAANFLYGNVRSYGLGVHPVRVNETCAELAFAATLPLIPAHFGASAADDRLALARARLEVGGPRAYPYLANSVWATSPARLVDALLRVDLATGGHPFDEAAMSTLFLHERNESLCVLRHAFAVHPHYGGSRFANRSDFEARLHAAAYGALLLRESVGDDHGALLS